MGNFIRDCSTEELLDLIEISFKVTDFVGMPSIKNSNNEFVDAINDLLRIDHLPYQLVPMVYKYDHQSGWSVDNIAEYPKAILYEEELTHTEAVLPALSALSDPRFASANSEFREAHNDYRDGRYGDCIRNCGNSLESTIKAIHKRNNWSVDEKAPISKLVESLLARPNTPQWSKQPILFIGMERNDKGTVHGAGNKPKNPDRGMTRYILTATATIISAIVEYT